MAATDDDHCDEKEDKEEEEEEEDFFVRGFHPRILIMATLSGVEDEVKDPPDEKGGDEVAVKAEEGKERGVDIL